MNRQVKSVKNPHHLAATDWWRHLTNVDKAVVKLNQRTEPANAMVKPRREYR